MSWRLSLIGILATAMIAATFALAQRGGGSRGGDVGGAIQGTQSLSKADLFADRIQLTAEQMAPVQKILNDTVSEVAPLRAQIDEVRSQIAGFIISGNNQDEVNKAMESLAAAEAQLTVLEGKAFSQVSALLNPKQRSKAAAAFDLLTVLLDPPGTASRAGSGGRRGRD
jgi:Spy/CpxP family protein refolding chaperone